MKRPLMLLAAMTAVLALPAWAQQAPAAGRAAETQAEATFAALAPLVAPRTTELSAAGVQKVVARTGHKKRDLQISTQWGPAYLPWPKGAQPVTFEIFVKAPNEFDVIAAGYKDADKARYAAAFDAVIPLAISSANALRIQAQRPKR